MRCLVFFLLSFFSCSVSEYQLKKGFWKLCDNDVKVPSDVLELNDKTLRNDTVFVLNKPAAIIVSKGKRIDNSNVILIRWLERGDTSRFCQK